jgi:hypothetical protein
MGSSEAPKDLEEFVPPLADPEPAPVQDNTVVQENPSDLPPLAEAEDTTSSDGDAVTPKKNRGRPKGAKNASRKETAPVKVASKKSPEAGDEDKKARTAVYLPPKEHKRLKMMCVDNDIAMTEFIADACMDAMYYSYQCHNPACNCDFIVRSSQIEGEPACPMCGEKKLSRPYLP